MTRAPAFTDRELLEILDLRDNLQVPITIIAKRFATSPGRISGAIGRCNRDCEAQIGPALDGTMGRKWWRDALRSRTGE